MGQSLVKNYIHVIYSTKNRHPLIKVEFEDRIHPLLGNICRKLESPSLAIGSYDDHIHVLCSLSKKISLVDFLKNLKSWSSNDIKNIDPQLSDFYWQDGYGAFSVSPSQVDIVISYINNQRQHHKSISFKEEYEKVLKQFNVEFDENYLWI